LSELLDRVAEVNNAGPGPSGSVSAFDRFLETLVPGELPSEDFTRALLYGAVGSLLTVVSAAALALLPSRDVILDASFYAVGRRALANFMGIAGEAALPVAIIGAVMLLATAVVALVGWRDDFTEALCVAQPIVGVAALGGAGLAWLALLAAIVLNLVIWVAMIALVTIVAIAFMAGIAGALLDG
jgi:hypothetical protein